MKNSLLILVLTLAPFFSRAHDFFFSFAEMEYNAITERFEMTLIVTTHDLERAMEDQGQKIENIVSLTESEILNLETYVNQHFVVTCSAEKSLFNFTGNEVSLDGTTQFYFESDPIEVQRLDGVDVYYDILMEAFPDQQNKLTFYFEDQTYTAAFTPFSKKQTIYLENNKQ